MSTTTHSALTEEQLRRIQENRRKALEKKANRVNPTSISNVQSTEASKQPNIQARSSHGTNKHRATTTPATTTEPCSSANTYTQTKIDRPNHRQILSNNFYSSSNSVLNKRTTNPVCRKKPPGHKLKYVATKPIINPLKTISQKTGHCSCTLISRSQFSVNISFNSKLIEIFNQMSSKKYDAIDKIWSFDLSEYDKLLLALEPLKTEIDIEPLPRAVTRTFKQQIRHANNEPIKIPDANLNSIDSELVEALMPFQRQGVSYAIARQGRLLIADEMGLGKTFQAICIACYYRTEWPLLIVSPSSLRFVWAETIQKWLPSIDPDSINVVQKVKDSGTCGLVNILSYDLMNRKAAELKSKNFQVVVMDESHFLKNFKSARTKAAIPILKNASRVILLSGTPALSRPSELYVQVNVIDCQLFTSFNEYGMRYCNAKQNMWGWDYSGSSNMNELQLLLEERIMVRRTKQQVLSQLPSKTRQVVVLDPSLVNTSSKGLFTSSKKMNKEKSGNVNNALLLYFNETGLAKTKAIRGYILDLLECGSKFLVFAHHQSILDMLCDLLKEKDRSFIRIDGSTNVQKRQDNCHTFQTNKDCIAAVLSITAANTGITLTAASLVIFAELFWNPGVLMQAEDRVHRIGQKECVTIRYLVAKNTADDYIWPLVQEKLTVLSQAGLSKDNFTDVDLTNFRDPKQTDIMSFFESSFMEDDDDEEMMKHVSEMEGAWISEASNQDLDENDCGKQTSVRSGSDSREGTLNSPKKKKIKMTIPDHDCI